MKRLQNKVRLSEFAARWVERFPRQYDERLIWIAKFLESSPYFASKRPLNLLFIFYFLQKKMESALEKKAFQKHLFLKLLRQAGRLSVVLAFKEGHFQQKEAFKQILGEFLPGFQIVQESFISWSHPTLPYLIWSLELSRLRGKDLSSSEMRKIETLLLQQFKGLSSLSGCFWPYNKEDAFRNIQVLEKEMNQQNDLPHLSIQFLEHTDSRIEFLLCLALPKRSVSLAELIYRLPYPISVCSHFLHEKKRPFPREIGAFSIQLPSTIHASSTLLRARRYLLQRLEEAIGSFRDCNGGLLEKQQAQFEEIHFRLGHQCANFDLFAERLFYALHFRDAWLILSIEKMADLFKSFSALLDDPRECSILHSEKNFFTLVKSKGDWAHQKMLQQIERRHRLELCAQLSIDGIHYRCYFGACQKEIAESFCHPIFPKQEKTLHLNFQEGPPPSLSPHYSNADIRCCALHKLVFEGLTRIGPEGTPSLAAAKDVSTSPDGRSYTFTLRSSYWSNGEKVRADHFVNSFRCGLSAQVPHPERLFLLKNARGGELGVRAIDAETLQIELEKPDPFFLSKLAGPSFMPLFGGDREPKWFNGPFLVHETDKNQLVLEKNPYFWDAQNVSFERIQITWESDVRRIFEFYREGKIDWIGEPFSVLGVGQIAELRKERNLLKKIVARQCSIYFNTQASILKSSKVRRALSQVVDNAFITEKVCFECRPIPSKKRPELAREWLAEGLSELGWTVETAPSLQLTISNHPRRRDLALYLQGVWRELGIRVDILELEWNPFRNQLEKRDFEIAITIQDTLYSDSSDYYLKLEGASSWNFSQWVHPPFRALFASKDWKRLVEEMLEREVPFIPLFQYAHLIGTNSKLKNYYIDAEGCVDLSRAFFVDKIKKETYHRLLQ